MGFQFQECFFKFAFDRVSVSPRGSQAFHSPAFCERGGSWTEGRTGTRQIQYAFARPCTVLTRTSRTRTRVARLSKILSRVAVNKLLLHIGGHFSSACNKEEGISNA